VNIKTVIQAALVGAVAVGAVAHAATFTAGTNKYSREYSQRAVALGAPTSLALRRNVDAQSEPRVNGDATREVLLTLSAAVNSGDTISLTLGGTAGAQFLTTSAITLTCAATDDGLVNDGTAITAATAPTATGFSAVATANCAAAATVHLSGAALAISSLQTVGTITLSANITRAGSSVDTANAALIAEVVQEFNVAVTTAFNGVVNNSVANRAFTAAGDGARLDRAVVTYTNVDVFQSTDITGAADDAVVVTLNGDFAYLNDDGVATCLDSDVSGATGRFTATAANIAVNSTCSTLTITQTAANAFMQVGDATGTRNFDIELNAADLTASYLRPQTFTGSAVIKYTAAGNAVAQTRDVSLTPGAHTGSGTTVFIPYMPVGSNISQILYVANTANVAGTLTIEARDADGVACTSANFGGNISVAARAVTNLATAFATGIAACAGTASKRWYVTITATVPDDSLEVYSAYNVGGNDRANVVNSSNGRPTATGQGSANSNGTL
jgi:hypothetical protein